LRVFLVLGSAGVPPLVALVLRLELVEVELQTVRLLRRAAEVRLHAEVEAGGEARASLTLIVVKVLVEIRH